MEKAYPNANYGASNRLVADASPVTESHLRFDVSGVVGAVTSAKLRLYVTDATGNAPAVWATSGAWSETGIAYSNRPVLSGAQLDDKQSVAANTWVEYDVSRGVSGNGTYNFALVATSRDGLDVASREDAGRAPELQIVTDTGTVATPTPAPIPMPTATPSPTLPPAPDSTAPTVAITRPVGGTTITSAQTIAVDVIASDASDVAKVEFYDNGALAGTEDTEPFSYSWAVTSAGNGSHRWTAKAYDRAGNVGTSVPVDVTVNIAGSGTVTTGSVTANVETQATRHSGDAADDSAVWVHPTDPSQSTVIGTDKLGGLAVYDLSGRELHYYADTQPNNVDIRYNFPLGSERVTLVATSDHASDTIRLYRVNESTRALEEISARTISAGLGIYGLCMYRSPNTGKYYVFDSDSSGTVQQWEIFDNGAGRADARKVRQFSAGTTTEGCVADDETGRFYVAEEDVAIWNYDAEPGAGTTRTRIDGAGSAGHLTADIEGLTIYYGPNGSGYLIASSQGENTYAIFDRKGTNPYIREFAIAAGAVDAVTYTDGIDVSNVALGASFPKGVFIAQDDRNDSGNQNFKLVPWESIAGASQGSPLLVDTSWDPRKIGAPAPGKTTDSPETAPAPGTTPDAPAPSAPATTTGVTYYVDGAAGSDASPGTSETSPWRTLAKVTAATLRPGDRVLLKRGTSFTDKLEIGESGTSAAPIEVGAYGSGERPGIAGPNTCVRLSGSYLAVRDLRVGACGWAGVEVLGSNDIVERNLITGNAAGVYVKPVATDTKLLHNVVADNNVMSKNTVGGDDDSGAFGILLKGDRTEVAYNRISGSDAFSYDYGRDGAAIEIGGAIGSVIHHNLAVDNDAFSELGETRTRDTVFAYNVVRSSLETSSFLVTRGASSSYGPIFGTTLYNNTAVLTGAQSKGVVCHAGCTPELLKMRNNIVQAVKWAGWADAAFDEDYNLWRGALKTQRGAHSLSADPGFVDGTNGDLRLTSSSPAVDAGTAVGLTTDFEGGAVPVDGDGDGSAAVDLGAYERR